MRICTSLERERCILNGSTSFDWRWKFQLIWQASRLLLQLGTRRTRIAKKILAIGHKKIFTSIQIRWFWLISHYVVDLWNNISRGVKTQYSSISRWTLFCHVPVHLTSQHEVVLKHVILRGAFNNDRQRAPRLLWMLVSKLFISDFWLSQPVE